MKTPNLDHVKHITRFVVDQIQKFRTFMEPYNHILNRYSMISHILLAALLNFTIEAVSRHSLFEATHFMLHSSLAFLLNVCLIFATLSIVFLFRRRVFWRFLISAVWLLLGISNAVLLSVRVTPFNAQDLKVLGDAISLSLQYFNWFNVISKGLALIAIITTIVLIWLKADRYHGKVNYIVSIVGVIVSFAVYSLFSYVAVQNKIVSNYFDNIAFAYQDYGFPYCFTASIIHTGISEPSGYSEEMMSQLNTNKRLTQVSKNVHGNIMPNILFVQLESFFDPQEVKWLHMSEDPIPNYRALSKNFSNGYFIVPTIGAGTANTEFEALTGMNMRYFGPGEYPYKTYARYHPVESIASSLGAFGYKAFAIHNHGGNFYSRAHVFNNMGFDTFVSKEFMNITKTTPNGWATDDVLPPIIMDSLRSTAGQDFVFTITVQSHGEYSLEPVLEEPNITVEVGNREDKYAWEYYVNMIHQVDQFIGQLIHELSMLNEPTVVVFYGDHLPTLDLLSSDLKGGSVFQTNYLIWDNIGLEKQTNALYAYQMAAHVFGLLGYHTGTVFNFHQSRMGTTGYLDDLKALQYDLLYGEQYVYAHQRIPFTYNHMKMGLVSSDIVHVVQKESGASYVHGDQFTKNSKVFINGVQQKTLYKSSYLLTWTGTTLTDGDIIAVAHVGSSKTIFRMGYRYEYINGSLHKMPHDPKQGVPGREAFDDEMPPPL